MFLFDRGSDDLIYCHSQQQHDHADPQTRLVRGWGEMIRKADANMWGVTDMEEGRETWKTPKWALFVKDQTRITAEKSSFFVLFFQFLILDEPVVITNPWKCTS